MNRPASITATVYGTPVPQGSLNHNRQGRVYQKPELLIWRQTIAQVMQIHAMQAGWRLPLDEPVEIGLTFYLPPPARPRWDVPAVKPDIDKLCRAVLDALAPGKGRGILAEDSRVIALDPAPRKHYATRARRPGVQITITRTTEGRNQ